MMCLPLHLLPHHHRRRRRRRRRRLLLHHPQVSFHSNGHRKVYGCPKAIR